MRVLNKFQFLEKKIIKIYICTRCYKFIYIYQIMLKSMMIIDHVWLSLYIIIAIRNR